MKHLELEKISKWAAVCTCIVMGGLLVINNKSNSATGFALGAITLVLFA